MMSITGHIIVAPAKAGTKGERRVGCLWAPAFAGATAECQQKAIEPEPGRDHVGSGFAQKAPATQRLSAKP